MTAARVLLARLHLRFLSLASAFAASSKAWAEQLGIIGSQA